MRRLLVPALALAVLLVPVAAHPDGAPAHKFVVPGISATTKGDEPAAKILTELVLDALLNRHGIRALGPAGIRSLLNLDAQKQLLGCSDQSCMAQIGGEVNADMVITGEVGRLGDVYVLTLKLIDAKTAKLLSRAAIEMHSLDKAATAVGPLVDKLLGAPAHKAEALAILGPAKPAPQAMDPRLFCPKVTKYFDALASHPYDPSIVARRKALLEDLMRTKLKADFDEKRGCIWDREPQVEQPLFHGVERAKTARSALDHRKRVAEVLEMVRDLKRVEEAWQMGLKEAENGTGQRPTALPFTVGPAILSTPTHPKLAERLEHVWPRAARLMARAIRAAKHKDLARFKKLYDANTDRTDPKYNFQNLEDQLKNGDRVEPCPLFILAGQQIDRRGVELHDEKLLRFCVRYVKPDWVDVEDLFLKKVKGRWRIDHW